MNTQKTLDGERAAPAGPRDRTFKPDQRVIYTKRGELRHYDTDWPATYLYKTPSGRHAIRMDGRKRVSLVRDTNLRAECDCDFGCDKCNPEGL